MRIAVVDFQTDSHEPLTKRFRELGFALCADWDEFDAKGQTWDAVLVHGNDYPGARGYKLASMIGCTPRDDRFAARAKTTGLVVVFSGGTPWERFLEATPKELKPELESKREGGRLVYLANAQDFEAWALVRVGPSRLEEARIELLHALLEGDSCAAEGAWAVLRECDPTLAAEATAAAPEVLKAPGDLLALRAVLFRQGHST